MKYNFRISFSVHASFVTFLTLRKVKRRVVAIVIFFRNYENFIKIEISNIFGWNFGMVE